MSSEQQKPQRGSSNDGTVHPETRRADKHGAPGAESSKATPEPGSDARTSQDKDGNAQQEGAAGRGKQQR